MPRLRSWLVAHDRWGVGAVLAVLLGFGLVAARVRLDFRYQDLPPQSRPFVEVHRRYHRTFSEANVLTVMIAARAGTTYTPEILRTVRATETVDRLPGVKPRSDRRGAATRRRSPTSGTPSRQGSS